ncbi:MAG: trehalose-phosphatase [Pseudomonas sp.]|nr:trehalose-phosphatase [Pseudomonas sp.]
MPRLQRSSLPAPPAIADHWALFLDVDGTLLEFAQEPDAVVVPVALVERLRALQRRLDGAMALVSGRSLATLDALIPALSGAPAAGLHGLEWRGGDGALERAPSAPAVLLDVHDQALHVAAAHDGVVVERKGPALALHWRRAPAAAAHVNAFAQRALAQLPGYLAQHGNHVIELRPDGAAGAGRVDKGTAIERFMQGDPFAGRHPVFVGDDLTDEHGFEVVNALGGLSVRVGGREPTCATATLATPRDVHRWLAQDGRAQTMHPQGTNG